MIVHCREALPAPKGLTCSLGMEERVLRSVGMGALAVFLNFSFPSKFSCIIIFYHHPHLAFAFIHMCTLIPTLYTPCVSGS